MVRSRLSRGKFIPPLKRWMSRPIRARQIALRRMSRARPPNWRPINALKKIRSRAMYNNYKLMRGLQVKARVKRVVKGFRARNVLRHGMRRWIMKKRLNSIKTQAVLSRFHSRR